MGVVTGVLARPYLILWRMERCCSPVCLFSFRQGSIIPTFWIKSIEILYRSLPLFHTFNVKSKTYPMKKRLLPPAILLLTLFAAPSTFYLRKRYQARKAGLKLIQALSERRLGDARQILAQEKVDVNLHGDIGETALASALFAGNESTVKLLLKHGADVNLAREDGVTPLMIAASEKKVALLKLLLDHDADPYQMDERDGTALQYATIQGALPIVKILLKHGLEANDADEEEVSLLMHAAANGHPSIF